MKDGKDNINRGWLTNKEYKWQLKTRPTIGAVSLKVYEGSSLMFDTGVLSTNADSTRIVSGKLGIFTSSQANSYWYDMSYECNDEPL